MDDTRIESMHSAVMEKLSDMDCDTDSILRHVENDDMSDFDSGMLAGLLGNKGVDPGVVAMLNQKARDGDWGGEGGVWIILLFLFMLGVGGGNGLWGGRQNTGVDDTVVNEANYTRLLDAVSAQGTRQEVAVQGLAQSLGCSSAQVQSALAGIDKSLAVNQGSIVNAIQSCCCNIQGKLDSCCCQTNLNIERTGNSVQSAIADQNYALANYFAAQNQLVTQKFCDQNAYLAQQFCDIQMRENQREIQALRDQVADQRSSAQTALILNAIANKDTISYTGTVSDNTVTGTGTLS